MRKSKTGGRRRADQREESLPVEVYTAERIAEFLLSNSVGDEEYAEAREEVKQMGFDPDAIPHFRPDKSEE